MKKPINEKFVKQAIIKWLFRNKWGQNLEVGELRDKGVDIACATIITRATF